MELRILKIQQMGAEIWDLGAGLEGTEGRLPTQLERFTRIAQAQARLTHSQIVEWLEKHNCSWVGWHLVLPDEDWQELKKVE